MKSSRVCVALVLCAGSIAGCGGELTDRGEAPDGGPVFDADQAPDTSEPFTTPVDSGAPTWVDSGAPTWVDSGPLPPPVTIDGGPPPPPPVTTPLTTTTTAQNFALHHIHLGDETDPVYGANGWKAYGYNIDGLDTTLTSTNVCTPNLGNNTKDQVDGPGGIDNSFGENIVGPLLSLLVSNPSQTVDDSIAEGNFTFLFDVTGLDGTAGQTATGLGGSLFAGLQLSSIPTFTTADNWPIDSTYVTSAVGSGGVLAQPVVAVINLEGAYVVDGTFVSGTPQAVNLALTIGGYQITLPIAHTQITFQNPGAGGATNASSGIISGVINTQQLIAALGPIAASNNLCSELPALIPAIEQAADILDDGTNVPGTPCTAVSVGIGFDADEIAQPTIAEAPPTAPPTCTSGG